MENLTMNTPEQTTLTIINKIHQHLNELSTHLETHDYDGDIENDYPFHLSIEEITAEVGQWALTYQLATGQPNTMWWCHKCKTTNLNTMTTCRTCQTPQH